MLAGYRIGRRATKFLVSAGWALVVCGCFGLAVLLILFAMGLSSGSFPTYLLPLPLPCLGITLIGLFAVVAGYAARAFFDIAETVVGSGSAAVEAGRQDLEHRFDVGER